MTHSACLQHRLREGMVPSFLRPSSPPACPKFSPSLPLILSTPLPHITYYLILIWGYPTCSTHRYTMRYTNPYIYMYILSYIIWATHHSHPPHLHPPIYPAAACGRIRICIYKGTPQLIRMFSSGNQRTYSASTERVARQKNVATVKF